MFVAGIFSDTMGLKISFRVHLDPRACNLELRQPHFSRRIDENLLTSSERHFWKLVVSEQPIPSLEADTMIVRIAHPFL